MTSLDMYIKEKLNSNENHIIEFSNTISNIIILIDELEFFQLLQTYFYHNKVSKSNIYFNYDAIIFHNETVRLNLVMQDLSHPVFEADQSTFDSLLKLASLKEKLKISITYDNTFNLIPINFLRFTTSVAIVILSIIFLWWHFISFNSHHKNFQHIQKIFTFILYLKLIITLLLFFYLIVLDADLKSQSPVEEMFLLTTAITVNTIYNTIFLFTIILLSYVRRFF
jgi:hypothetical protein